MTTERPLASQPSSDPPPVRINFFRPRPGYMRRKVTLIRIALAGWALATFGGPLLLVLFERNPRGEGVLTDLTLFGFPLHFWLTGQFLILCFVLLCLFFNLGVDYLNRKPANTDKEAF
jgi:putative solute:sodium symporter small subunit